MNTRIYLNRTLANGIPITFATLFVLMAGFSLLNAPSLRPVIFLGVVCPLLAILWFALARGTYILVEAEKLTISRAFLKSKATQLSDVVSIEKRPTFGGLFTEVYMKVRNKDGTFRNQGLINKPGLKREEYKRLFDIIRSANPNVSVDQSILDK